MFTQTFRKRFVSSRPSLSSSFSLFNIASFNIPSAFLSFFLKRLASVFNCPSILARQIIRELLVQRRFTYQSFEGVPQQV